mgnify:CR=1 FL=1
MRARGHEVEKGIMHSYLLRQVRDAATGAIVDARLADGRVEMGPSIEPRSSDEVVEADGRWLLPGLWDAHVHFDQWAVSRSRLDLRGAESPEAVTRIVGEAILARPDDEAVIFGFGYRASVWNRQPTVAELDAVTGSRPAILISGDMHNGWLNSAALALVGVTGIDGLIDEDRWFPLFGLLQPYVPDTESAVRDAMQAASARGVVGIVDLEFAANYDVWPERLSGDPSPLRVRTGVYPDRLDAVLERGLRSGDALDEFGLVRMGPLKIISDGSLGTRTAHCCDPYLEASDLVNACGVQTVPAEELHRLLGLARTSGLDVALHALGDAAVDLALGAFEQTGARGSIEHAQVIRWDDVDRLAQAGLTASVQPAHLYDDRDVMDRLWADRADRCFAVRTMKERGVNLALGSDAPVSPLDPWLAMAAAVHRSADERGPWHPEQSLTAREALAASTDGVNRIRTGDAADVVLVDRDPFAGDTPEESARNLVDMPVAATFVGGRVTHWGL